MNTLRPAFPLLVLAALSLLSACGRQSGCADLCDCSTPATAAATTTPLSADKKSPAQKHPLKGVVTDVLAAQTALMVKHEEIPGVMGAMTMMFSVDSAVLKTVKKGDAITALMSRRETDWRLDDVKVVTPAP